MAATFTTTRRHVTTSPAMSNSSNHTGAPSPFNPIPADQISYVWVGFLGVVINALFVLVSSWRILVRNVSLLWKILFLVLTDF